MFSRSPFMLSSLGPLEGGQLLQWSWPYIDSAVWRGQYCTAAGCHPPCSSKLETSGLFKTWLSPQTGAGTRERADLNRGTYTGSEALGKLGFVRQMKEGWCSISPLICRAGEEKGGNFLGFLFYNNFHKILFECVSCLRHLWFFAQHIFGLVIFCPLSW